MPWGYVTGDSASGSFFKLFTVQSKRGFLSEANPEWQLLFFKGILARSGRPLWEAYSGCGQSTVQDRWSDKYFAQVSSLDLPVSLFMASCPYQKAHIKLWNNVIAFRLIVYHLSTCIFKGAEPMFIMFIVCPTGSAALSLRKHPAMPWSCASGQAGPLGLLQGSHSSSFQVLRTYFNSTFQVGEKPRRGTTNWAKVSLKFNLHLYW